jgi:transcriptional regulator with XRE-family HTH domain
MSNYKLGCHKFSMLSMGTSADVLRRRFCRGVMSPTGSSSTSARNSSPSRASRAVRRVAYPGWLSHPNHDRVVVQSESSYGSLGEFIREKRTNLKLSLRDLASMTNVCNAYLSQVERNLHQPSIRVLRAIADALELTSEEMVLFTGLASGVDESSETQSASIDTQAAIMRDPRLDAADWQNSACSISPLDQ